MNKHLKYLTDTRNFSDGCWLWPGATVAGGYGKTHAMVAHRYSYAALKGEILPNYQIDHLCSVRACVNPEHLDMVTLEQDGARKKIRNRWRGWATHCARGHEMNDMTTAWRSNGRGRQCRICQNERTREHYNRKGMTLGPLDLTKNGTLKNKHLYDLTAEDYTKANIDLRFVEYFWQFDRQAGSSKGVTAGVQPKGPHQ